MKPDRIDILGKGLETLQERERIRQELAARTWKESEIQSLREIMKSGEDAGSRLAILYEERDRAEKEGRLVDDLSPTLANLRAKHGAGAWIFSRAEIGHFFGRARNMNDLSSQKQDRTAAHTEPLPLAYEAAASRWVQKLGNAGRIAQESDSGLVFLSFAPGWASPNTNASRLFKGPVAEDLRPLAEAQKERFSLLGDLYELILETVRTNPEGTRFTPPDAMIPFPQSPGMRWESFATPEDFDRALPRFVAETREALQIVRARFAEILRTKQSEQSKTFAQANADLLRKAGPADFPTDGAPALAYKVNPDGSRPIDGSWA